MQRGFSTALSGLTSIKFYDDQCQMWGGLFFTLAPPFLSCLHAHLRMNCSNMFTNIGKSRHCKENGKLKLNATFHLKEEVVFFTFQIVKVAYPERILHNLIRMIIALSFGISYWAWTDLSLEQFQAKQTSGLSFACPSFWLNCRLPVRGLCTPAGISTAARRYLERQLSNRAILQLSFTEKCIQTTA